MTDKVKQLVLYPLLTGIISEKQKSYIAEIFNINEEELINLLNEKISIEEINSIANEMTKEQKIECFNLAKKILEVEKISMSQLMALAELGKILNIKEDETGFDFNIYNLDEVIEFEFNKTLINFSMVAGAIGFIPFIPFSDYFLLTPLQIAMITKIFNLYKFDMEPSDFLKIIGATAGIGLLLKGVSKIITNVIPFFGWVINASVAFAGTYSIGIVARRYALAKGEMDPDTLKNIWEQSFEDGKKEFEKLKKFIFEQKESLFKEFKKYTDEKKTTNNEDDVLKEEEKEKPKTKRKRKKESDIEDEDSMFQ
ncbi:MAG TPA: hypothetical protein PLE45_10185 [Spirochaetota bacterium]|mgnify:CR=1 FL=1|nr:hypothetical protein [Spirochaetota bacterium]HOL57466.1 hypothetical protein [Spirochaetota bacterium]HPP04075.1 hypothetical protein [Spirochaetota bacterium]